MPEHQPPSSREVMSDIEGLRAFIEARVQPLLAGEHLKPDDRSALHGIVGTTAAMRTVAANCAEIDDAEGLALVLFYCTSMAMTWSDHPDFLPEWAPYQ